MPIRQRRTFARESKLTLEYVDSDLNYWSTIFRAQTSCAVRLSHTCAIISRWTNDTDQTQSWNLEKCHFLKRCTEMSLALMQKILTDRMSPRKGTTVASRHDPWFVWHSWANCQSSLSMTLIVTSFRVEQQHIERNKWRRAHQYIKRWNECDQSWTLTVMWSENNVFGTENVSWRVTTSCQCQIVRIISLHSYYDRVFSTGQIWHETIQSDDVTSTQNLE